MMCQYQVDTVRAFVEGYLREQNVLRELVFYDILACSTSKREERKRLIFSDIFSVCSHLHQISFLLLFGACQSMIIKIAGSALRVDLESKCQPPAE